MRAVSVIALFVLFIISGFFTTGCLTAWNVTGNWNISMQWDNSKRSATFNAEFTGNKEKGTFTTDINFSGSYTVTGYSTMTFILNSEKHVVTYYAIKQDINDAKGTFFNEIGETGTFTMSKTG